MMENMTEKMMHAIDPWTDLTAEEIENGVKVNVWGREYVAKDSLFFSSVLSQGEELLAAPIRIVGKENGQDMKFHDTKVFFCSADGAKMQFITTAESDAFMVNTRVRLEFDGVATVEMSLMPRGFTVPQLFGLEKKYDPDNIIDNFYLEIPLKKETSNLYHFYPCGILPDASGGKKEISMYDGSGFVSKDICSPFASITFVGNDSKGFFTYFESDRNWQPAEKDKAIRIINKENETCVRFCLIDGQPIAWQKIGVTKGQYKLPAVTFRFSFQASPVKPFPANPYKEKRLHIDCYKKLDNDYDEFLANPVVEGSDEIGYDRIKRLGVTTLILHEKWNQIQNFWKLTAATERRLNTIIGECHKRGIKVYTYFGYEMSSLSDMWYDKADEYCQRVGGGPRGLGWYRFPAQRERPVCQHSDFSEKFAAGIDEFLSKYDVDGLYLDGTGTTWNCNNVRHGCGYYDEDGVLHETYTIYAVRNLYMKLHEIALRHNVVLNSHVSDCFPLLAVGFADDFWLGEYIQYGLVRDGAKEMPEGYLRSTHSGRNFGVPSEFIVYENKPIWTYDDAFSFSLIHGVLPRPNDIGEPLEKMSVIWKIVDSFPIEKSVWCPYHENSLPFVSDNGNVKISGYSCDGKKYLLFIANTKAEPAKVTLSGFDGFKITDAEAETAVETQNGSVGYEMPRFGHKIFVVEK